MFGGWHPLLDYALPDLDINSLCGLNSSINVGRLPIIPKILTCSRKNIDFGYRLLVCLHALRFVTSPSDLDVPSPQIEVLLSARAGPSSALVSAGENLKEQLCQSVCFIGHDRGWRHWLIINCDELLPIMTY